MRSTALKTKTFPEIALFYTCCVLLLVANYSIAGENIAIFIFCTFCTGSFFKSSVGKLSFEKLLERLNVQSNI